MSIGTAIFLIALVIIALVTWFLLTRRPAAGPNEAPRTARMAYTDTAPSGPSPVRYAPAPPVIMEQPVYAQPYRSPMNDLTNLIIAEEIIDEIHEERREERFEDMREDRFEERGYEEPARYEAPPAYEEPDNSGGGWGNDNGGDFGSGDSGSF